MPRRQDILFGILGLAILVLAAFHIGVAVLALVGAFVCGSIFLFAGMVPAGEQGFLERAFTSGFLAIVLSSLVLIVPGTFGPTQPLLRETVMTIAGLLPLVAIVFEIIRTPRVLQGILRCLGR